MRTASMPENWITAELHLAQMEDEIQDDELSTDELDQLSKPQLCLNKIPTRTVNFNGRSIYNTAEDCQDDSDLPPSYTEWEIKEKYAHHSTSQEYKVCWKVQIH